LYLLKTSPSSQHAQKEPVEQLEKQMEVPTWLSVRD